MIGIYKITEKSTQKNYIGQSLDISKRWEQHLNDNSEGWHKLLHDNSENLFLKKQLLSNVSEWDIIQSYSALKDDSESLLSYKL